MDIRNWNKVLLQWITKCNFVENNFFNVEQTNIDAFYQKICSQHKEASKFSTLQSLLQTHYPYFKPHMDDENALSAAEYIYVYSLLLHFCCVKCPEEYFQIICQKLSEQTQQSIALFFEHIMAFPNVNKEIIRQAIAEVNNVNSAAQQQKCESISSSSFASSNGVNSIDLQTSFCTSSTRFNGESPVSTPSRKTMSAIQRSSPDTPKSSLLEERTRELYNYKALLETERYEKNLLELQINQNEKQMESMIQDHKNLQQKIQELKDELLNRSIDPNIDDREEDDMLESLRNDLCKKIREKEEENYRLFDKINTLREEKSLLESKLRLAEDKLASYREYIKDLEFKVDELAADIQKKDLTIKSLTDDKADLEHFIAETRSASGSSRPNLDSSIDCLDASFTRYTNSSGSLGSPENLGAAVVDVQLREKEHENKQLRQELSVLRARQTELVTFIQSKTNSYMQEFTFETNNNANVIKGNDALDHFNFYAECMNNLGKSFKDAKNQIISLEHGISEITCLNSDLNKHIDELECEVNNLKKHIKKLEMKNDGYINDIQELQVLKQELAKNYECSISGYEASLKEVCEESEKQNAVLNQQILMLEKDIDELNRRAQSTEAECNSLREKSAHQTAKLQAHMESERLVKTKYEQVLIENNDLCSKIRESDEHLEEMRSSIRSKEIELGKLGKEIVQLGLTNVELEEKINKIKQEYNYERSKRDAETEKLKSELTDLQKAYERLQKTSDSLINEKETAIEKLANLCEKLQESVSGVDLDAYLDIANFKVQKLLDNEQQMQMERSSLIQQHETEIEALNGNLLEGEKKIQTFKDAIEALTKAVENSKQTIDEMALEVQNLQAQTISLKDQHQEAEINWSTKQEQLEAELKGEKEVRAVKEAAILSVKNQLEELDLTLQAAKKEKVDLEEKIQNLSEEKSQLELQLKAQDELKDTNELLHKQKAALETQIFGLKDQNESLQTKLTVEAELNSSRVSQLKAVNSELEGLQKQHKQLQQDLEAQLAVFNLKQIEWKNTLEFEKQSHAESKQTLADANVKLQQLESNFDQKLKCSERKVQELMKENQRLITEIAACKDEQKATESNLLKIDEAAKEQLKELEETKTMLAARNAKLEESQQMIEMASKKLSSKSETLKALQATYNAQKMELQQLLMKCENQTTELDAATKEIESLKFVKEKLQCTCDEQNKELLQLQENQKTLKTEKEMLESKLQKIEKEFATKTNMFETKIQALTTANSTELSQLTDAINQKEKRINELEALLHDTENCFKAVNDDSAKLQNELEKKESELRLLHEELSVLNAKLEQAKSVEDVLDNIATAIENTYNEINDLLDMLAKIETTQPRLQRLKESLCKMTTVNIEKRQQIIDENEKQAKALEVQLNSSNELCTGLQLKLEAQTQLERNLNAEQKRLKDELQNLEAVYEKVCQETQTLQHKLSNSEIDLKTTQDQFGVVRTLNERLTEKIEELDQRYLRDLEVMKAEQQTLCDQLSAQKLAYQALQKQNDEMQTEASEAETAAEQRFEDLKRDLVQLKSEKDAQEEELSHKMEENNLLSEKLSILENKSVADDAQIAQLKKKNIVLSVEFSELNEKHQRLYDEIQSVTHQLEEANTDRTSNAEILSEMREKNQKLENDFQAGQVQLKALKVELDIAIAQHQACLCEKEKVCEELNTSNRAVHNLSKEVNELKQKIALSDLEKDDLRREMELLRTQVEVNSRYQTTSESKLKSIIETSQALERNLLSSDNELKTMRAKLTQSKANTEKLDAENQKLRDSTESLNKRIEKYAVKLGDAQALASKLDRENEKINKQLNEQIVNIEALQREKNVLQSENKSLNERLSRSERLHEQISSRLQAAEKTNATLLAAKKALETSEVDLKAKVKKLENMRQISEDRLRKMTHDCERSEREVVSLNLQIGALNNEICCLKKANKAEEQKQKEELNKQLCEARTRADNFEQFNKELESRQGDLKNQLEAVTDKLSKITLALEISNSKKSELSMTMEQLENKFKMLESDKADYEKSQKALTERLKSAQDFTEQLLQDKLTLEEQLAKTNTEILNKNTELAALRLELNDARLSSVESTAAINDKTSALVAEIESLRARLKAIETLFEKEQETTAQLRLDNQILQAKYRDAKHRIEAETSTTEERIKENRLELEGKLEKMKNKMKALYTEEVTKIKAKQERETASLRAELSALKSQNLKYDEHTRKLSAELMSLNDRMLECQKENTHLLTKLKYIQSEGNNKFKRPNTSNVNAMSTTSTIPRISSTQSVPSNIGTNLAMEDEEGEIFNNTYLADLKNGRITNDICAEELMRRNSQLPPHLKSSYAPQYDHGLCEDEVKSNGLDDSMSALITSSTSCSRKKISGVTNYRKPGPPTPSKNGGRLSFGGNSEPTREILKESYDENSSNRTPARFGFFSSRFSMGNSNNQTRDEQQTQKQEQNYKQTPQTLQTPKCNDQDLRRVIYQRKFENQNVQSVENVQSVTKMLTSTPRPSKHRLVIDKRRLINEMQNTASTPTGKLPNEITPPELSAIETQSAVKNSKRRLSGGGIKKLKPLRFDSTRGSIGIKVAELQRRIRRRRDRKERPSLCVQKNIYASKCCTPQRTAQRDLNRFLGRRGRRMNFDRQRNFLNISSDGNDDETFFKKQPMDEAVTSNITNDSIYDISNTKSRNTTDFEEDVSNIDYERSLLNQQTIDGGVTYSVVPNENFQTHTIIHSRSNDEITYINSHAVANASNINISKTPTALELSVFDEELEQLEAEICSDSFKSNVRFEKLLRETECQAPFKVDSLRLSEGPLSKNQNKSNSSVEKTTLSSNNKDSVLASTESNSGIEKSNSQASSLALVPQFNTPGGSQNSEKMFECITPTPHCSKASPTHSPAVYPRSSLIHHSRTIYGASVIYNRIPNIDGLRVRKSSIYFKNPKCSTFRASCNMSTINSLGSSTATGISQSGDLILVTNQTITIVDLICMWQQMSSSTRMVVGAILIGCLATILALLHSIWNFI